jgi:hypothetical protein
MGGAVVRILLTGLVLLAMGLVGATARSALAQAPDSAGTYVGTLSGCESLLGQAYWFEVGENGSVITSIHVVNGIVPGLSIPVSIPISSDGSFAADFSVAGLARVILEGRFLGDTVSGTYSVDLSGRCGGAFSAQRGSPPTPAPTSTPRPPEPMQLLAILPRDDGCGGGTLSITISADRGSIIRVSATGISGNGATFAGSATFPEGAVPIASDGTFGWVYFPGDNPGQEVAVNGTYAGTVRGLLTVSPSECAPIAFNADPVPVAGLPSTGLAAVGPDSGVLPALVLVALGSILFAVALRQRPVR